jgi:drug/metabolite transporter (DMT)-like permease
MIFGIASWLLLGLLVGFIISKSIDLHGDDPLIGILAGLGGAVVGGVGHAFLSGRGVVAWDMWNMLFTILGAAAGAGLWHGIRSRSISHERGTVRSSYER